MFVFRIKSNNHIEKDTLIVLYKNWCIMYVGSVELCSALEAKPPSIQYNNDTICLQPLLFHL